MLSELQSQALYPVLQHYTGSKITFIYLEGENLAFDTIDGESGEVLENHEGNWDIVINGEVIENIERMVFEVLVNPDQKITMDLYLIQLNELVNRSKLKYRSKLLVRAIIKLLEDYILTSDFAPKIPIQIGPFIIGSHSGIRTFQCLN